MLAHLSRGRSLDVYDAWSIERDCRCIAKVVRPDRQAARVRRRLAREGELLLGLTHPHIVRAYELRRRPRTALILETLDGETAEHMIETAPQRLAIADVAHLGVQLCSAIGYLHSRGFLHLDLKPSNVIVENGQARVIDLSLAARPGPVPRGARDSPLSLTRAGPWGPGRLRDRRLGDRGHAVRGGDGSAAVSGREARELPAARAAGALGGREQAGAGGVHRLIGACLSPEPSDRPSVAELADELDGVIGG